MDIKFNVTANDSNSLEVDFSYHAVSSFDDYYDMQVWSKTHVGRRGYQWEARYRTLLTDNNLIDSPQAIFYFNDEHIRNLFSLKWC